MNTTVLHWYDENGAVQVLPLGRRGEDNEPEIVDAELVTDDSLCGLEFVDGADGTDTRIAHANVKRITNDMHSALTEADLGDDGMIFGELNEKPQQVTVPSREPGVAFGPARMRQSLRQVYRNFWESLVA